MIEDSCDSLGPWPESLYNPPGLAGDVVKWMLESSGLPQQKFSVAAALTVLGCLVGRGVKDYSGQRTNLFTLAVAPSSGGKNDPMKFGQMLIKALGREKRLSAKVTSDTALEILVSDFPVRCMFLDEVGDYLGSMKKSSGGSNPYLMTVIPCLKELWSKADGIFTGKARAADSNGKWKPPRLIDGPHVSIYGTGAPSRLFEGMTERDFDDGSIPRFVVFIEDAIPKRRDVNAPEVPNDLLARIQDALSALGIPHDGAKEERPDGTFIRADTPNAFEVGYSDGARDVINSFESFKHEMMLSAEDDPYLYLWGKAVENARRIALIVAAFRSPQSPMVDECDAIYAVQIMQRTVSEMINHCRQYVASTERERDVKALARFIRRRGTVPLSEITRCTQGMKRQSRYDALDDLIESETIKEIKHTGRGRKSVTLYKYIGNDS